ncbi:MAG TPA: cupredoxin domain-containing protein [Actinomycetota bacterium]|nr:cupredoxin domain-containing protein [Actinomycetota bacterium]
MAELRGIRGLARLVAATTLGGLMLVGCGGAEAPECEDPVMGSIVTMADFSYQPSCIEAAAGDELEILNDGSAPHTFTVESDGAVAEADVPAGERATLTVPAISEGTYPVSCTYHPQMEAALRIAG